MKVKKLSVVLLAALLSVSCFTACGDDTGDKQTTDPANTVDAGTAYHVPESKYNGEDFTILTNTDDGEWTCNDFFQEEDSDENVVLSAVYARQKKIEETFGVKIKVIDGLTRGSINTLVETANKAGTKDYDLVINDIDHMFTLARGDGLTNLDDIEYLDTTVSAWDQSTLEQTSIGGNNYFATGEITTIDNDATWCLMFNKQVAKNVGIGESDELPSIYELVEDKKWTLDKFTEYCNLYQYQDKTGDGPTVDDQFPVATTIDFVTGLFYGTNNRIILKDEADIPYLPAVSTKMIEKLEKIVNIYYKSNFITFDCHDYKDQNAACHLLAQQMFEENRSLFYSEVMQCVTRLRNMDVDFGIVPMPKADESQKNYTAHSVNIVTHVAGVPKGISYDTARLERSGMIMQALAVEGENILTPAYYEKSLVGQGTRDEESSEMLPIIFGNRIVDLGYISSSGELSSICASVITIVQDGDAGQLSRYWQRNKSKVEMDLNEIVEQFESFAS